MTTSSNTQQFNITLSNKDQYSVSVENTGSVSKGEHTIKLNINLQHLSDKAVYYIEEGQEAFAQATLGVLLDTKKELIEALSPLLNLLGKPRLSTKKGAYTIKCDGNGVVFETTAVLVSQETQSSEDTMSTDSLSSTSEEAA